MKVWSNLGHAFELLCERSSRNDDTSVWVARHVPEHCEPGIDHPLLPVGEQEPGRDVSIFAIKFSSSFDEYDVLTHFAATPSSRHNLVAGQDLRSKPINLRRQSRAGYVEALDFGDHAGRSFFVMPNHPMTLRDLIDLGAIHRQHAEICEIVGYLLAGIDFVHSRGFMHLDLKPSNVVYLGAPGGKSNYSSGSPPVRIIDFEGAYNHALHNRSTRMVPLTPAYSAPELHAGGRIGAATDLYSVGCIAYELIAGHPPFSGSSKALRRKHLYEEPSRDVLVRGGAPQVLLRVVGILMNKNPTIRRGENISLFINALRATSRGYGAPNLGRFPTVWNAKKLRQAPGKNTGYVRVKPVREHKQTFDVRDY